MKKITAFLCLFASITSLTLFADEIIAHWDFSKGSLNTVDGKIQATARGTCKIAEDASGRFLLVESYDKEKPSGIITQQVYPVLSPVGAFRIEFKFRLRESTTANIHRNLWDNQYVNYKAESPQYNHGFQLLLIQNKEPQSYTVQTSIGDGKESRFFRSKPITLDNEKIYSLDFTFNGLHTGIFRLDGEIIGESRQKNIQMSPAVLPTVIGDRFGSSYNRLDGDIFEVKLLSVPTPDFSFEAVLQGRRAFHRSEKNAKIIVHLNNASKDELTELKTLVTSQASSFSSTIARIPGSSQESLTIPVETRLNVGKYPCTLHIAYTKNGEVYQRDLEFDILIGPVRHDFMPVLIWGFNNDYNYFRDLGFTHGIHDFHTTYSKFSEKEAIAAQVKLKTQLLDEWLLAGFYSCDYIFSVHDKKLSEQYPRLGSDGKPLSIKNPDASNPELVQKMTEISERTGNAFGQHPAFDCALLNSEVRDNTAPTFSEAAKKDYEKYSGKNIPDKVTSKFGPNYKGIADFPLSRIIPEDDDYLSYYTWFWKNGDGWNPLHSAMHHAIKKGTNKSFFTFFDPAVRVPPLWGSGGDADVISHWTYAYPEPLSVGVNTCELQAMARGRAGQRVMNMTQIICYRSVTAPIGQKVENEPLWVKDYPKAPFITLAPDLMREAVWTQLSRQTEGIMFHGYNSLIFNPKTSVQRDKGYQCTNPETKDVLKEMLVNVVKPLGATLKRLRDPASEVAVLESFASYVYTGRATWGWTGWQFYANIMLNWANLRPSVLYEEEVLRDGFGQLKVLFLPECEVLSAKVFEKLKEFQKQGGILIGDQYLVPGITPDIFVQSYQKTKDPVKDKKQLQELALDIRAQLQGHFSPYTTADNPDLVTWVRKGGKADYLFVINDKRTFGDYYGQYGLVMEKGMPNAGNVSIKRQVAAVYDLVKNQEVAFSCNGKTTDIPVEFSSNGGQLFLLTDTPIAKLKLELPAGAESGKEMKIAITVNGKYGRSVEAIIPIAIELRDSSGNLSDDSHFAAAENGVYTFTTTPPLNAPKGTWTVTVKELASGKTLSKKFIVR